MKIFVDILQKREVAYELGISAQQPSSKFYRFSHLMHRCVCIIACSMGKYCHVCIFCTWVTLDFRQRGRWEYFILCFCYLHGYLCLLHQHFLVPGFLAFSLSLFYIHTHSGIHCLASSLYILYKAKISLFIKFNIFISIVSWSTLGRLNEFISIVMNAWNL